MCGFPPDGAICPPVGGDRAGRRVGISPFLARARRPHGSRLGEKYEQSRKTESPDPTMRRRDITLRDGGAINSSITSPHPVLLRDVADLEPPLGGAAVSRLLKKNRLLRAPAPREKRAP